MHKTVYQSYMKNIMLFPTMMVQYLTFFRYKTKFSEKKNVVIFFLEHHVHIKDNTLCKVYTLISNGLYLLFYFTKLLSFPHFIINFNFLLLNFLQNFQIKLWLK